MECPEEVLLVILEEMEEYQKSMRGNSAEAEALADSLED